MNKYKIIINRAYPSKEEVLQGKDFQALFGKYQKVTKPFYKKVWFQISGVAIILSIVTVVISIQKKSHQKSSELKIISPNAKKINVQEDNVANTYLEEGKGSKEGKENKDSKEKKESNTSVKAKNSEIVKPESAVVRKEEPLSNENIISDPVVEKVEEKKRFSQLQLDSISSLISKLKAQAPVKPRKAREKSFRFNLDVLPNEFPELANYKDVIFEIGLENENVAGNIDKIDWERGDLKVNEKGLNYILTLQNGKDIRKYIVYPVYEGKSYDEALRDYELYQKNIEDLQNILKDNQ